MQKKTRVFQLTESILADSEKPSRIRSNFFFFGKDPKINLEKRNEREEKRLREMKERERKGGRVDVGKRRSCCCYVISFRRPCSKMNREE